MTKKEMFYLLQSNYRLESFLRMVLKEKEFHSMPDFGERLQFTKEGVRVTKFNPESGCRNCVVEEKSLNYDDPRFKAAFNEAIDLSVEQLKKMKL